MCKIKYYLLFKKNYPQFFFGITMIFIVFKLFKPNSMNLNETKRNLTPEFKTDFKKSKLEVLTNENDFLVKNLKKAG